MRIFWITNNDEAMTPKNSGKELPIEVQCLILTYMPRSTYTTLALVCKLWYNQVMPMLYKHIYICTRYHWDCLLHHIRQYPDTWSWLGPHVTSLVLHKSPRLAPARAFTGIVEPFYRGYVRIQRVNMDITGLEHKHDNYDELDTAEKEAEWLLSVTPDEIRLVLQACHQLRYLDLSGCEQLGDEVLASLSNPHLLQGVWLPLVRDVSEISMRHLTPASSHLKYLDLSYCSHLGDNELVGLLAQAHSLTHIRLCSLYQVTDETVRLIAENCPKLQSLYLARCWQVTNHSIRLLARHCPELAYLCIAFLSRVNDEIIDILIKNLPHLRWMDITGCGINPMFKPMLLQSWANAREGLGWDPVQFIDQTVHLL